MQQELSLFSADEKKKSIIEVETEKCILSKFNPRATRPKEYIEKLAQRIQHNGFEITRALWAYKNNGLYEVFAGGTRLEAAKMANLKTVHLILHEGYSDEDIVKLANDDNENDEYHTEISILDKWAECWRLKNEFGWTGRKIADVKNAQEAIISKRINWHENLSTYIKEKVCNGIFDEGHITAISSVFVTLQTFSKWITTESAQIELVDEIITKHRGSSAGIKPTVKNVTDAAKEWKEMIESAEDYYSRLDDDCKNEFVNILITKNARTKKVIQNAYSTVLQNKSDRIRKEQEKLLRQQNSAEAERIALERKKRKEEYISLNLSKIVHGDILKYTDEITNGIKLTLIDPPYPDDQQSNRAVVGNKADKIINSDESIIEMLSGLLPIVYKKSLDNSAIFVFTSWKREPEFRTIIQNAGYEIKNSIIWNKDNHGAGDLTGSFAPKHERIIFAIKGTVKLNKRLDDVLEGNKFLFANHPTKKPTDLLEKLIETTTDEKELVIDLFAGIGSTPITAFNLNRDFWACEIDESYYKSMTNLLFDKLQKVNIE